MAIDRRRLLVWLAGAASWPAWPAHSYAARQAVANNRLYLTAGAAEEGRYRVSGFTERGEPVFDLDLPGRGHSVAPRPGSKEAVFFARRPGAFAEVVDLSKGGFIRKIEAAKERHFYGHGVFSQDGRLLYATENDFAGERGVLGIYAAERNYARIGELSSHGIGPHDVKLLSDGTTLAVANGGILTRPDLPRVKLNIPTMTPSLVYLDRRDGALLDEIKLPPELHQLSIRHLALGEDDRLAVAMQYEGPGGDSVPLVFTHRRAEQTRFLDDAPKVIRAMKHYCGSTAFDSSGRILAVSAPRGGLLAFWNAEQGKLLSTVELPDVCGVAAAARPGGFLASSGAGGVVEIDAVSGHSRRIPSEFLDSGRWDNHMVAVSG